MASPVHPLPVHRATVTAEDPAAKEVTKKVMKFVVSMMACNAEYWLSNRRDRWNVCFD